MYYVMTGIGTAAGQTILPLQPASRRWAPQGPTSPLPACSYCPSAPLGPGTQVCRRKWRYDHRDPCLCKVLEVPWSRTARGYGDRQGNSESFPLKAGKGSEEEKKIYILQLTDVTEITQLDCLSSGTTGFEILCLFKTPVMSMRKSLFIRFPF